MKDAALLGRKSMTFGIGLAVVGALLAGFGYMQSGFNSFAGSYLFGWMFWGSTAFGFLSMTILFNAMRGRWTTPVARIYEAGGGPAAMALLGLLLIPAVVVFKDVIYAGWLHASPTDMLVVRKNTYLNLPFWYFRIAGVLVLFALMGNAFKKWTRQEELTGDEKYHQKRNNLSGFAMVAYVLLLTFFVTDIVMSIDPHWSSTMFGFIWVVVCAISAVAFSTLFVLLAGKTETYGAVVKDDLMKRDFGNMLLMLTMFWAYFNFSQFLIMWSGNLPENSYYFTRLHGEWNGFGFSQIAFNFLVPFILLLSPGVKRDPIRLGFVAAWIFFFHFFDVHYIIMPFFRPHVGVTAADFGCFALIGGIWLVNFGYQLGKAPLVTAAHPYQERTQEAVADAS